MKISLKWLREYVDVDWDVRELVERLTMAGLEEESVEDLGASLSGIVVGKVVEREQHPNADRLSVCRVDVGEAAPRTIVCGAPNVAAGQTVPVVLPGSQLPDGTAIGKAKLRGVASEGMICSQVELGLGDDSSGIMVLPDAWPAGAPFARAAGLDDVVIDFEVTPNRPDCLSLVGIAREVAALSGKPLRLPEASLAEGGPAVDSVTRVDIEDPDACPRYVARVLRGVRVGPSPAWLQDRLRAVGQRPINNVVDVTNFVMLELGQPLHAFDLHRLAGERIIVRRARGGETLRTLDGADHELDDDQLVIADAERPVAVAGVMGGADSEVCDTTTHVLLESASFAPTVVRRTARRLGMHTEASSRFERGADWDLAERASARAAALIAEVAGGEVAPGCLDVFPAPPARKKLTLRPERAAALLALPLDGAACRDILVRLGCGVSESDEGRLDVEAPSWRPDLEREIDLVEEVGRIHGYADVPVGDHVRGPLPPPSAGYDSQRRLRRALTGLGLDEIVTSSIVADDWAALGGPVAPRLANPPADGMASLRTSLVPGLLDVARRNVRQRAPGLALFEVGRVFLGDADDPAGLTEALRAAGLLAGTTSASSWRRDHAAADLLDLKGVVEALLSGVPDLRFEPVEAPFCRRGHAARILSGEQPLGTFGQVDERLAARFDLPWAACIFELDCRHLFDAWAARGGAYRPLPKYPPIERDLAVVLDAGVPAEQVAQAIRAAAPDLVEDVSLFDVYSGDQVAAGQRSLAFSLRLRSPERTLEDRDADDVVRRVLKNLESSFQAQQR